MAEIDATEVLELMRKPTTIWAPNGWTFEYTLVDNPDVKNIDDLFSPGFLRHELRGPNGEEHLWIFDSHYDLVPNPTDDDLPRSWPIVAGIALQAYQAWCEELPNF